MTAPIKVAPVKKAASTVENKKTSNATNGAKAPVHTEKSTGLPMAENKTKQNTNNVALAPTKAVAASAKAPALGGKGTS